MTDLATLYPSMADAAQEAPAAPASGPGDADLRAMYPSMYPDPPPTGGSLLDRLYPSMVVREEPYVDPGDDPEAMADVVRKMLYTSAGRDRLSQVIAEDGPDVWAGHVKLLGLQDDPQIREMLQLANMYPSMRRS